jgi:hypothetical protein
MLERCSKCGQRPLGVRGAPRYLGLTQHQWRFVWPLAQDLRYKDIEIALGCSRSALKRAVRVINVTWGTRSQKEITLHVAKLELENSDLKESVALGLNVSRGANK